MPSREGRVLQSDLLISLPCLRYHRRQGFFVFSCGLIINRLINIAILFALCFPRTVYPLTQQEVASLPPTQRDSSDPVAPHPPVDNLWLVGEDTSGTRPVELPEIITTATRFRDAAAFSPSSLSTLNEMDLQILPARTVGEALSGVPGLTFRSYGGRQGIQTIAIRGASTEQTLVLVDGMRMTNTCLPNDFMWCGDVSVIMHVFF